MLIKEVILMEELVKEILKFRDERTGRSFIFHQI